MKKQRRSYGSCVGNTKHEKYNNSSFASNKRNCPATTQPFNEFYDLIRQECDRLGYKWPTEDTCLLLWYHRFTPVQGADMFAKTILGISA